MQDTLSFTLRSMIISLFGDKFTRWHHLKNSQTHLPTEVLAKVSELRLRNGAIIFPISLAVIGKGIFLTMYFKSNLFSDLR